MVTATAKAVVASGFGSTPGSRRAVTQGPKKPAPATAPAQPRATRSPASRPTPAAAPGRPKASPGRPKATTAKGRPPSYRRPARGGGSSPFPSSAGKRKPIRIGSVRTQHILTAELLACLLAVALNDIMVNGTIEHVPIQGTALVGLFLILALISSGGASGERIAVGFGGLVTLYVLMRRVQMMRNLNSQLQIVFGNNLTKRSPTDPSAPADSPGPPVTAPAPPATTRIGGLEPAS